MLELPCSRRPSPFDLAVKGFTACIASSGASLHAARTSFEFALNDVVSVLGFLSKIPKQKDGVTPGYALIHQVLPDLRRFTAPARWSPSHAPILSSCRYPVFAPLPSGDGSHESCLCKAAGSVRREFKAARSKVTATEDSRRIGNRRDDGQRLEWFSVHGEFRQSSARPAGPSPRRRGELRFGELAQVHLAWPVSHRARMNEVRKGMSHRFPRTGSHPFDMRIRKSALRGAKMVSRRVASQTPPHRPPGFLPPLADLSATGTGRTRRDEGRTQ